MGAIRAWTESEWARELGRVLELVAPGANPDRASLIAHHAESFVSQGRDPCELLKVYTLGITDEDVLGIIVGEPRLIANGMTPSGSSMYLVDICLQCRPSKRCEKHPREPKAVAEPRECPCRIFRGDCEYHRA